MNENTFTAGSVFKDTIAVFKKSFWRVLGALIVGFVAYAFLLVIGGVSEAGPKSLAVIVALLVAVLAFILQSIIQLAVIRIALKDASVKEAIYSSFGDWKPLITISIIVAAITYGATLFLIIPGLIVGLWFLFSVYVFADERLTGMDALMRSKSYVVGRWWNVFGYILLGGIASIAPFILAALGLLIHPIVGIILMIPALFTAFIFPVAYIVSLYKSLVASRPEVRSAPAPKPHWFEKTALVVGLIILLIVTVAGALAGDKKTGESKTEFGTELSR